MFYVWAPHSLHLTGEGKRQPAASQPTRRNTLLNPAPNMKTLVTWKQPPKSLLIPKEEVLFLSSAWKPCHESKCGQISYNPTHLSRFSSEVTLEWPCSGNQNVPKRSSGENQVAQGRAYQHGAKMRVPTCCCSASSPPCGRRQGFLPLGCKMGVRQVSTSQSCCTDSSQLCR